MESLVKMFDKLSQYQILNYFIPGSVLCVLLKYLVGINLVDFSIPEVVVICYFVGMVNSRLGSIILQPCLKAIGILKEAPYKDYVSAEKKDEKVTTLSEVNNMYRSLTNAMLLLLLAYGAMRISIIADFLRVNMNWIAIVCLLLIFVISYTKQTSYVRKRVEANTNKQFL